MGLQWLAFITSTSPESCYNLGGHFRDSPQEIARKFEFILGIPDPKLVNS